MTDIKNNGPGEEQLVIDKQYKLQERSKSIEIIRRAMDLAREEIPKGKVATYIPELGKVDPHQLGIVVNPLKGEKICMGDYNVRFTMQSVCKVIMLIMSLEICGLRNVFHKVGMEPSGEAFDSLVELDVSNSKPYNPLINSGGLALCGLLIPELSFQDVLRFTRNICSDPEVDLNEAVYDSEMKTCSRNRSIAYLLESKGIITTDVEDTLRFYTKMCSMTATAESLSNLGVILANDGVCGETGPTKSGVGGGLLSVSDKRAGLGVFGPALDTQGNSIAGCKLLREISNDLRLNLFYDPEWNKETEEENELIKGIRESHII